MRLCARETEWGARAAPITSLLLSQPLQALLLGHFHRVSEDGEWVREVAPLIEGSTRVPLTLRSPPAAYGQSAQQPAQQQQHQQGQQQQTTLGALEFTN